MGVRGKLYVKLGYWTQKGVSGVEGVKSKKKRDKLRMTLVLVGRKSKASEKRRQSDAGKTVQIVAATANSLSNI